MVRTKESASRKGKEVASDPPARKKGEKRQRGGSSLPANTHQLHLDINLAKCKVHATKFINWADMAHLGVKDDMEMMFTAMGVNQWMHQREFTHADETVQFLGSLATYGELSEDEYRGIQFTIHGETYILEVGDLRDIYGFERVDMTGVQFSDLSGMLDLWHRTASGDYQVGKSKGSCIRNPAIKLVQRALGFSLFGRHEVGQVILEEWRMICHALRPLVATLTPPVQYIPRIDPCLAFISNLFSAQAIATRRKSKGWALCIGGVLTPMFRHCGIDLSTPLRPIPLIDIAHLRTSLFLTRAPRTNYTYPFTWNGRDQQLILPRRALVRLTDPANITFHHVLDGAPEPPRRHDSTDDDDDETHSDASPDFDLTFSQAPQTPLEREMVQHIGTLQSWIKAQARKIKKMAKAITSLKRRSRRTERGESSRAGPERIETPPPSPQASPQPSAMATDSTTPPSSPGDSDFVSQSF